MTSRFTVARVTREAVWLRPVCASRGRWRPVRVEWELLTDLADDSLPVNADNPDQVLEYKRLLQAARDARPVGI